MTEAGKGAQSSVRIQIRCADLRDFGERFAPWYAADGILIPGVLTVPVGGDLRVTVELQDGRRVFSGRARVEERVEVPPGTRLRVVRLDPGSAPLAPVLSLAERPRSGAGLESGVPLAEEVGIAEILFADLPAPEEFAARGPIEVRRSAVKLRMRSTPPGQDPQKRG